MHSYTLCIDNRILLYHRSIIQIIPVQVVPSPVNPSLHSQVYELIPCIQVEFVMHGLEIHSSMSKKIINIKCIKVESKNIYCFSIGRWSPRPSVE